VRPARRRDGELHRVAVETIKSYRLFDAPDLARGHVPRWARKDGGIGRERKRAAMEASDS
jgi:hypothetical protein